MRGVWGEVSSTLVPARGDRHGPLPPVLLGLTVITGLVDAFSYLVLGHVFVANMTGNVVFAGFSLAGAEGFSLAASLVALAAFAAGALGGGRVVHRDQVHRGRLLRDTLVMQTVLVLAAYIVAEAVGSPSSGAARYVLIVLLGLAMGLQNAAARALAVPDLTTTVLTLTITGVASDSRVAGGSGGKAGRRLLSVLAMVGGAYAGAAAVLHGYPALPLLIAAILLVAVGTVAFTLARSNADWTKPL